MSAAELLAPRPMTSAEVADLVDRVRAAMRAADQRALASASAVRDERSLRARAMARVVARLAYRERISVAQAARDIRRLFGVGACATRAARAFHDIYPDVPIRYRSRSRCMEAARFAISERITAKEAAARVGLSKSGVAKAVAKLRCS
ncbi:MAG TPA: hypothetical protein VFQ42_21940 [Mycobacterium sp.]|nr:hypothetical protein [Mycobacterium sp.]